MFNLDDDFGGIMIMPKEWHEIQHLVFFLKPFAEATITMSGQTYSTISGVIVLFNAILDHLDTYKGGKYETLTRPPAIIQDAAKAAYKKIVEYYNKTNDIHCIVTLLDPRCNLQYFINNDFTPELYGPFMDRQVFVSY
jgi:hypothetical protein